MQIRADAGTSVVPGRRAWRGFGVFLQGRYRLDDITVERWGYGPAIQESYAVDAGGRASVRITDTGTGYSQVYGLG